MVTDAQFETQSDRSSDPSEPQSAEVPWPFETLDRVTERKLNGFWRISIHGHPGKSCRTSTRGSSLSTPLEDWK
jgi:hypothetical protein